MKPALIPAAALGAILVYYLLRLWLAGDAGEMEGIVTLVGAFTIYFYLVYGVCSLLGVAPEKRLTWAYGGPVALFALLVVLGLFTGGSSGGWIALNIRPHDFWATPGMLVWSTLRGSGTAVVRRTPLDAMASRNFAVEFMAAVPRANGELVVALHCESPEPSYFSQVVRLSAAGDPVEDIASLPYLLSAEPRPDGTMRLAWREELHGQAGTVDLNNKLQRDPAPVPDTDTAADPKPPLTAARPDGATYSVLLGVSDLRGDDREPDRIVLLDSAQIRKPGFEIRTDPANDRIDAIHVEPDSGLVVIFDVLGIHRFFYRREKVWPRVERFGPDGTPDKRFNESVRSIGQGMDMVKLLARMPSGELVLAAQQVKGRARLYYVAPDGSIRRQRDF